MEGDSALYTISLFVQLSEGTIRQDKITQIIKSIKKEKEKKSTFGSWYMSVHTNEGTHCKRFPRCIFVQDHFHTSIQNAPQCICRTGRIRTRRRD